MVGSRLPTNRKSCLNVDAHNYNGHNCATITNLEQVRTMASLIKIKGKRGTTWRIDFYLGDDPKRKSLRVGTMNERQAGSIKSKVELLIAAKVTSTAPDLEVSRWVSERDDDLHAKLALHGLVAPRVRTKMPGLMQFVDEYIARRTDVQKSTVVWYRQTRRCLVDYFGGVRLLDEITTGDAKDFRRWLTQAKNNDSPQDGGQGLGENTARKRCAIAKQIFADAVDREIIERNPFAKLEGLTVGASIGRDYFVPRDESAKVIAACPDVQWQLLFALSRYGGLRCPSEHLALRWGDVDWSNSRIAVRSPKTAHHEGKGERIIPLFPELRPHLQAAYDELLADFDPKEKRLSEQPVISRYRGSNANLRTQLCRIITKAGLTPWPKLFQNLRSTRATELAAEFPAHVAAEWMGHSTVVADKHYWRVTDADFDRAAQHKAQQSARGTTGQDVTGPDQDREIREKIENAAVFVGVQMLPVGLEPTTY
jgi:integrase